MRAIRSTLPELPWERRERYIKNFNLSGEQAEVFVNSLHLSVFFEEVVGTISSDIKDSSKRAANYIVSDLLGLMKEDGVDTIPFSASRFAELITMIAEGELSSRGGKDILLYMYKGEEGSVIDIAKKYNLIQSSDDGEIRALVEEVIKENPQVVSDYKGGKESSLQFLVGQGMKKSKGSANPQLLKEILKELI